MKKFIITLLFVSATLTSFSQGKEKRDRIKALKIAHITEKLDLSAKEAQEFWPIYNTYNENITTLRRGKIRNIRQEIKQNYSTLTEEKSLALLNQLTEAEKRIHSENVKLTTELKTIISPKKILLLKIAEEEFNRKLFDQIRNRHQGNKNRK